MVQTVGVVIGVISERMRNIYSGGRVMVRDAFLNFGQVGVTFWSLKMDQDEYIQALEENLLDYYIEHNDGTWKFLHDNAPVHCGNRVKQFLFENLIEIMISLRIHRI